MKHLQRGISLLEVMIAITISGIILAAVGPKIMEKSGDVGDQVAATELKEVIDATKRYVRDNFATIQAAATPTTPYVINVTTIRDAGYLRSNFTGTNPYGQAYRLHILEPAAGRLEGLLVTTGGTVISGKRGPMIGSMAGNSGGYIAGVDANGDSVWDDGDADTLPDAGVFNGAYGGWSLNLAQASTYFTVTDPMPSAGHLAAAMTFDNGTGNDFLYRNAVPGFPEANQMNTAIDMNANDLNNVANIAGNGGALGITGNTTVTGNASVTGTSTLTGDVTASNNITVSGQSNFNGNVNVAIDTPINLGAAVALTGSAGGALSASAGSSTIAATNSNTIRGSSVALQDSTSTNRLAVETVAGVPRVNLGAKVTVASGNDVISNDGYLLVTKQVVGGGDCILGGPGLGALATDAAGDLYICK